MLLERSLGGAVTLVLAGVGLLLAIGRYPIGRLPLDRARSSSSRPSAAGVVFFSRRSARRLALRRAARAQASAREPARAVYDGIHGYRDHLGTLAVVAAVTLVLQLSRVLAIYASARAVGIGLSPLPYIVLGPLLFLVMLVPFTVNGLGVREAFFVSFLGKLGVPPDSGVRLRLPLLHHDAPAGAAGLAVLLWEGMRGIERRCPMARDLTSPSSS